MGGHLMRFGMCLVLLALAAAGCHAPMHQPYAPPMGDMAMGMGTGPCVDGPGPGVMSIPGAGMLPAQSSQVAFVGPEGMMAAWEIGAPGQFSPTPLVCPARYNFPQGAIYRLKLTNIPGYEAIELYPTLEVGPTMPRTQAFLAHNAIPIELTPSDFEQVLSGNFVTKVIYLPDPEYQELALAGVETLVSTRLDPGVDPIVEADRRGAILGVLRLGNKDLEIPGETPTDANVMPVSYNADGGPVGTPIAPPAPMVGPMAGPMGAPMGGPMGVPMSSPMGASMGTIPTNYISGVTGPQYGIPITGTPIGLPGPPHIPLGSPAGLQKHVIKNHTPVIAPGPRTHIGIHVRETPGYVVPRPSNHAWVSLKRHAVCGPGGCGPALGCGGLLGSGGLLGGGCDGSCVSTTGQPCSSCQQQ